MDNYEIKYTVGYFNISGDEFLLEIYQKSEFTFNGTKLAGSVTYTKGSIDDIFEPIRPTTLTINLEASQTNVLEDFQSFNEFDFKVKFYRNGGQIFEGWINPDGWFQDWVNDKWEISMTAVDGLGTLKNLEFLDGEQGQVANFSLFHTFQNSNTELQLQLQTGDNWLALGFQEGTEIEILSGVNMGRYLITNLAAMFMTCDVIVPPAIFFNGPFSCDIQWGKFTYAPREMNYLHAVLKRLEYELPYTIGDDINLDLGVPVDWIDVNKRIIDKNVFINDNGTWQDCETILKDILQKYNLTITQENIEGRLVWYISRAIYAAYPNDAKRNRQYNTTLDFSEGSDSVEVILEQFAFADGHPKIKNIFSEINTIDQITPNVNAIHCNENQQITFNPALQNFRFQSTWKGLRTFLGAIPEFWSELPPLPIADLWGIFNGYMKMFQIIDSSSSPLLTDPLFQSINIRPPSPIETSIDVVINWWVDYNFVNPAVEVPAPTIFRFLLQYTTDTFTRYYNADDEIWQTTPELIEFEGTWPTPGAQPVGVVEGEYRLIAPPGGAEPSGRYILTVYNTKGPNFGEHECRLTDVQFLFDVSQFGTGKVHDSTQPEVKSTFLNDPIDVINTNEPNAYFQNNLYREAFEPELITGLIAMNRWKAFDTPQYSDLLELTGRERIRAKAKPQRLFRGDIFGFIPYSSVIRYDGIPGNFVPLSYQYRTVENVIELECSQIFNEDVEINHEKKYIFENERNVLIKEL